MDGWRGDLPIALTPQFQKIVLSQDERVIIFSLIGSMTDFPELNLIRLGTGLMNSNLDNNNTKFLSTPTRLLSMSAGELKREMVLQGGIQESGVEFRFPPISSF